MEKQSICDFGPGHQVLMHLDPLRSRGIMQWKRSFESDSVMVLLEFYDGTSHVVPMKVCLWERSPIPQYVTGLDKV
jgi:hypothetical protein